MSGAARQFAIMDPRAVDDFDAATLFEVCDSLAEAKRHAPEYGDGCCVFELTDDGEVFVWQHGSWLTSEQMATEWGTNARVVVGIVVKLGLRDATAHARGHGSAREYSPEAQGLIHREWRSYGRPA